MAKKLNTLNDEVNFYGAVIREDTDIFLSVKMKDGWTQFTSISDDDKLYANLPLDKTEIVSVRFEDTPDLFKFSIKSLFSVSFSKDEQVCTVKQAYEEGTLFDLLDGILKEHVTAS